MGRLVVKHPLVFVPRVGELFVPRQDPGEADTVIMIEWLAGQNLAVESDGLILCPCQDRSFAIVARTSSWSGFDRRYCR